MQITNGIVSGVLRVLNKLVAQTVQADTVTASTLNGALTGSARSLSNKDGKSRQTTANQSIIGDGNVYHFLATSSMATNTKPVSDGHMLHFEWDNTGGYSSQTWIRNSAGTGSEVNFGYRGMSGGTWSGWTYVLDTKNYKNYASPRVDYSSTEPTSNLITDMTWIGEAT